MSNGLKLREPTCYGCPSRLLYEGNFPVKKQGINMKPGESYCTYERKARRFMKRDPVTRVPAWCPKRLTRRKMRIYGFKDVGEWLLHERLCCDLGRDLSPEGRHYAVEQEMDTDLTAKEFLERSVSETDAQLLSGVTLSKYQVLEIDDGLQPVFFYKTAHGYVYEPFFNAKAAEPLTTRKDEL